MEALSGIALVDPVPSSLHLRRLAGCIGPRAGPYYGCVQIKKWKECEETYED